MRRVWILGLIMALGWGCDAGDEYISLTLEQRSTTTLNGLGFDGQATIHVGDIESNDLVDRTVEIEEIEIVGTSQGERNTLLAVEDARTAQTYTFYFEGARYRLQIRSIETNLFSEDTVDVVIGYE